MRHNATIHQGVHCKLRLKRSSDKNTIFYFNYNLTPLKKTMNLSKFILSNQKEEPVSIQRIKLRRQIVRARRRDIIH